MKILKYFAALLLMIPCMVSAEVKQVRAMTVEKCVFENPDPDIEWTLFKDSKGKAEYKKKTLDLECNEEGTFVVTTAKFKRANVRNYFEFGVTMRASKLGKDKLSGIVFDYKDRNNFQAFIIDKKRWYYVVREQGQDRVEGEGDYKVKKNFGIYVFEMIKDGAKISFYINGVLADTIQSAKRCQYNEFGLYTSGKSKIECYGVGLGYTPASDDDESDDDESDD